MKTRHVKLVALLTILLLQTSTAIAEEGGDCNRGCPDSPPSQWIQSVFTVNHLGCSIGITYKSRRNYCAVPGQEEFELVKVTRTGTCSLSTTDLLTFAMQEAVNHNALGFLPLTSNDSCSTTTVVSLAACWYEDCIGGTGEPYCEFFPCATTCCWRRVKVCFQNGRREIVARYGAAPGTLPGCPTNPHTTCASYCTVSIYIAPPDDPQSKPGIGGSDKVSLPTLRTTLVHNTLSVHYESLGADATSFELVNTSGVVAARGALPDGKGSGGRAIEVDELPSGTYILAVRNREGRIIANSTVTIAR